MNSQLFSNYLPFYFLIISALILVENGFELDEFSIIRECFLLYRYVKAGDKVLLELDELKLIGMFLTSGFSSLYSR